MNYSSLDLHFHDDLTLHGEITYKLDGDYPFTLDPRFAITEITDFDGNKLKYKQDKIEGLPFFGVKNAIKILDSGSKNIKIKYCSKGPYKNHYSTNKWINRYNHFEKNIIALDDGYIAFYPALMFPDIANMRLERPEHCSEPAKVYGLEDFYVLNSTTEDDCLSCYTTCPEFIRYKILAFRKGTFFEHTSGLITTITQLKKEKNDAIEFAEKGNRVINWYNENLYTHNKLETPNFYFSHGKAKNLNGFWRNNIIEYDRFIKAKVPEISSFIPHEVAHNWCMCTGDYNFSDKLLEEGGAEWSAGIYRFNHDKEVFERLRTAYIKQTAHYVKNAKRVMKKKDFTKEKYLRYLLDPHHSGFYFFNSIYEKYGIKKVKDCILYFVSDENNRNIKTFLEHAHLAESAEVYSFLKEQFDFILPYCK